MKINIPEKIKKMLYVTVSTRGSSSGELSVNDYDCTEFEATARYAAPVLICTTEIEIDLPPNFDVTEPLIALLEKRRESIVQEFSLKLKAVDQELAEVRALPAPTTKYPEEDFVSQADRYAMAMARGEM